MPTSSVSVPTPSTAAATGYMQADGFVSPTTLGTPIGTDGLHSKGAARFPFGVNLSAATLAAAGATQGNATTVTAAVVNVTATASTEGIKLTSAYPLVIMEVPGAVGSKVYPPTNAKIGAASTNAAVLVAGGKGGAFAMVSSTLWIFLKGA